MEGLPVLQTPIGSVLKSGWMLTTFNPQDKIVSYMTTEGYNPSTSECGHARSGFEASACFDAHRGFLFVPHGFSVLQMEQEFPYPHPLHLPEPSERTLVPRE